jgi:hypothetical protein
MNIETQTTNIDTHRKAISRAGDALAYYANIIGANTPLDSILSDLLTDLRHVAQETGIDYDTIHAESTRNYYREAAQ